MIPLADEWDAMLSRTEPMESQTVAEDIKPWTIKNVPTEERNAAIAAADRADVIIGEWMVRAIRNQVKLEQRKDVAAAPTEAMVPAVAGRSALEEISQLIELHRELQSLPGASDTMKRMTLGLIRDRLKAAKG